MKDSYGVNIESYSYLLMALLGMVCYTFIKLFVLQSFINVLMEESGRTQKQNTKVLYYIATVKNVILKIMKLEVVYEIYIHVVTA